MNLLELLFSVLVLSTKIFAAEKGSPCITPNKEQARCLPLSLCPVILNAVFTESKEIFEFLRSSQCGFDTQPLVCCGSYSSYAKRGAPCLTPYRKTSTCIGISQCPSIKYTIAIQNKFALDFARASQCGYDTEPLVCCGSVVFQSMINSSCVTPSNEQATCTPVDLCPTFIVLNNTEQGKELMEKSHCGFRNNTQLVCCGTTAPVKTMTKSLGPSSHSATTKECGFQETPKILGGTITDIGEFPWMALLRYLYKNGTDAGFRCGGTLIDSRYVLTAAHCIALKASSKLSVFSVRLGEWQISSDMDCYNNTGHMECADPVIDVVIKKQIPHPEFDRDTMFNDIALLQLKETVIYSAYVRPICLPSPSYNISPLEKDTKLHLSGWGATENSSSSDFKLKVQVPIIPRNSCLEMVFGVNVTDKQICAGAPGLDSCRGDSGGPIMRLVESEGNRWFQEGIISWGIKCGIVGVYTKLTRYVDWITENISKGDIPESTTSSGVLFVD